MAKQQHKPGERAPGSGQYPVVDPETRKAGAERAIVKSESFPPTPGPGQAYSTPDLTKHASDKQ